MSNPTPSRAPSLLIRKLAYSYTDILQQFQRPCLASGEDPWISRYLFKDHSRVATLIITESRHSRSHLRADNPSEWVSQSGKHGANLGVCSVRCLETERLSQHFLQLEIPICSQHTKNQQQSKIEIPKSRPEKNNKKRDHPQVKASGSHIHTHSGTTRW